MKLAELIRAFGMGVMLLVMVAIGSARSAQASPVLRLSFEDGSGSSTAADSSGNGLNGSLVNMDVNAAWVPGVSGDGLAFDGGNDYLQVLDHPLLDFGTSDFAVSFWVYKRATTATFDNIWGVNKWNTGSSPTTNEWSISLAQSGNDRPSFSISSSSTTYSASSSTDLTLNAWEHVVGVRENDVLKLYMNGVLEASTVLPGTLSVDNVGRNLRIANSQQNANYSDAIFDEIQIYGNALTIDQVGFLFANPGLSTDDIPPPPIPEPGSLVLLLGGLVLLKRRKRTT